MSVATTSLLARSEVRRTWRVLVALGLLAGAALGVALAAAQVARRTSTAYDRLVEASGAPDAVVIAAGAPGRGDAVTKLPDVERSWKVVTGVARVGGDALRFVSIFAPTAPPPPGLFTPVYVEGGPPDPDSPNDLVVSERIARDGGFTIGERLPVKFLTAEEATQFDTGFGEPDGPALVMRVVGITRTVADSNANSAEAFSTPALARRLEAADSAAPMVLVQLRGGADALPTFQRDVRALASATQPAAGAGEFFTYQVQVPGRNRSVVDVTTRVLVLGLSAFAAVTALAGLLAAALALRRQVAASELAPETLRALGATTAQIWRARVVALSPFAVTGTIVAVVVAVASSSVGPAGSIARREPAPGWHPNVALLAAGGALVLLLLLALIGLVTLVRRGVPAPHRPNRAVGQLTARGAPAPAILGARYALEAGGGRSALPVRSALLATALGLTAIVGVLMWSTNVDRLVDRPDRWGWVADAFAADVRPETLTTLVRDPNVAAVSLVEQANVDVGGHTTTASALTSQEGNVDWTVDAGRMPRRGGEILVGTRLARDLGVGVGGRVAVHPRDGHRVLLDVVGTGSGPTADSQFAGDVVVAPSDLHRLALTDPFRGAAIRYRPGVDQAAATASLAKSIELELPTPPPDVDNLAQLGALPRLLAAVVAALVLAVLLHFLVTTVRRRRDEFASLRALGLRPAQTRRTVLVTALVITGCGLAIGLPLGFVVGRFAWHSTEHSIYVGDEMAVPLLLLAGVAAAAVLATVAISAWPAWLVTRRPVRPVSPEQE